jgi:hypothetical protein
VVKGYLRDIETDVRLGRAGGERGRGPHRHGRGSFLGTEADRVHRQRSALRRGNGLARCTRWRVDDVRYVIIVIIVVSVIVVVRG